MASGLTLVMRNLRRSRPRWIHQHRGDTHVPYVNRAKDRTLAGKARRRARRAAR